MDKVENYCLNGNTEKVLGELRELITEVDYVYKIKVNGAGGGGRTRLSSNFLKVLNILLSDCRIHFS